MAVRPAPIAVDAGVAAVASPPPPAPIDAGAAVTTAVEPAVPAPSPTGKRFDRARAERMLADCRFPVDPAHPDPALAGRAGIVDWGTVTRREAVLATGGDGDGEHPMSLYELTGARGTYRFDGDGVARLGSLDVAVGSLVVVCPFALPATAEIDHRTPPVGWRTPSVPVYAFAPAAGPPRLAGELADRNLLHVPDAWLRAATDAQAKVMRDRNLLVLARPAKADGTRWDMGGWTLDATDLPAGALTAGNPIWIAGDHLAFTDTPDGRRATLHATAAVRRLLP